MRRVLGASLFALLSLGGCDDGGDALSHDEYVARANARCEAAAEDIDEEIESKGWKGWEGLAHLDEAFGIAADRLSSLRDDLGDLNPPDADADDVDTMMTFIGGVVDYAEDYSEAIEAEDDVRLREIEDEADELRESGVGDDFVATMERLGLRECVEVFFSE